MIYTSYYANIRNLPKDSTLVSISRGIPKYIQNIDHHFLTYAPSSKLLKDYKYKNLSEKEYIQRYYKETLNELEPYLVYSFLLSLIEQGPLMLLCYEKPGDFCHRHIYSNWLNTHIRGCNIQEWSK